MADAALRRRIWGWYFFDWASQPYNTLLLTFIFGPYFAEIARAHYAGAGLDPEAAKAQAQALWGYGLTAAGVVVAVLSPVLGAIADGSGRRLAWVWLFSALYVLGAAGLWVLAPDGGHLALALVLFAIGFVAMEFATNFTNALMPDLVPEEDIGAISGSGFAFGYAGGVLSLVIMLLLFAENATTGRTLIGLPPAFGLDPSLREGTRAVGPFTAFWYLIFMVPFFLWVHETRAPGLPRRSAGASLHRLLRSVRGLAHRGSFTAFLVASMVYRDALNGLYAFGGVYAGLVLGWSVTQIGVFGILGAVAAGLATWAGGRADKAFGPKPVIAGSILVLAAISALVLSISRTSVLFLPVAEGSKLPDLAFYLCGALIGAAGGTVQAASRTLAVRHTTREEAAETFGLFALAGKATAFVAPFAIALTSELTGNTRMGMVPLIALFLIGLLLLAWVKPDGDRRAG